MKEIPLSQGKVALVDDEDFEELSRYKWFARCDHGIWYALRNMSKTLAPARQNRMHNQILGRPPKGFEIDHHDGNGLDNRRANLRVATRSQNNANGKLSRRNTSGIKGVFWKKSRRKWEAKIGINCRLIHLGMFADKEEAIRVRRAAAQAIFGEFDREESREPVQAEGIINGC
jgi:hypothetical protein